MARSDVLAVALVGVIALLVLGAASWVVVDEVGDAFVLKARLRRVVAGALWALSVAPAIRFAGGRTLARSLGPAADALDSLAVIGFLVATTVTVAALPLLFARLVRSAVSARSGARRESAPAVASASLTETPELGRRVFLRRSLVGLTVVASGSVGAYAMLRGRHDYVLEEVVVSLARLPRALDGLSILQISDVHLGAFVGDTATRAAESFVRRARPDLVVLTGDLVDHDPRYLDSVGRFVRRLAEPQPRYGVVSVLGNHDYYAGADEVLAVVQAAGARTLRNEGMSIGDIGARLSLLGIDDLSGRRFASAGVVAGPDLSRTLRAAAPDTARILLCHNPAQFVETSTQIDLQLSGHTHGGQLSVGVAPAAVLFPHGYIAGRYTRGAAQLYVNRGLGTAGPPARIGVPPEVTRIVLVAG